MRRMTIIPFLAKFSPNDSTYDPMIKDKITTEDAKSYILNIAIKAAQKLIRNKKFTIPDAVTEELNKYEESNNNVLSYLNEVPPIYEMDVSKTYANYCLYCVRNNTSPYKVNKLLLFSSLDNIAF